MLNFGSYQCVFTGRGDTVPSATSASRQTTGSGTLTNIACQTPDPSLLPDIPTGEGRINTHNRNVVNTHVSIPAMNRYVLVTLCTCYVMYLLHYALVTNDCSPLTLERHKSRLG